MFTFAAAMDVLPILIILGIVIIGVGLLVFEVMMFISAFQNKFITTKVRILWLVGMLFIHPFVAAAYYITDYTKTK